MHRLKKGEGDNLMVVYKPLPTWYDLVCLCTSITFAFIAGCMYVTTEDRTWLVVVLSGMISAIFRQGRLKDTCDLRWGSLCSPSSALVFGVDLVLAVLCFLIFLSKVRLQDIVRIATLMLMGWVVMLLGGKTASCCVHTLGHISLCFTMWKMLTKERQCRK